MARARRIIPARAGFTAHRPRRVTRTTDHPRSRGVYLGGRGGVCHWCGSSPLARGLQNEHQDRPVQPGIIPARAGFTRSRAWPPSPSTDHPRSRGVYQADQLHHQHGLGSSPLARGLRVRLTGRIVVVRIIPARAGFTARRRSPGAAPPDHPRSRGVYSWPPAIWGGGRGSSPLARGLPEWYEQMRAGAGIIPARAGFTVMPRSITAALKDHPRSRGVYPTRTAARRPAHGSSPLARGLHEPLGGRGGPVGIIPARAGFTLLVPDGLPQDEDHPRSRGVYRRGRRARSNCCGSSPLARGLLSVEVNASERAGIIPARAGFTRQAHPGRRGQGDHPRSRGVYPASSSGTPGARGSSPLARGLRRRGRFGGLRRGIIPARAGFTGGSALPYHHETDHPRSRGVYSAASLASWRMAGSSPLARGLHRRLRRQCEGPRIIPARAGFTRRAHRRRHLRPDHPRSRGVYRRRSSVKRWRGGSSPLARGLPVLEPPGHLVLGIIPARAGFTLAGADRHPGGQDHPRSRGVYHPLRPAADNVRIIPARAGFTAGSAICQPSAAGSSPLARGLRASHRSDGQADRIIPARAGFTRPPCPISGSTADHPRSRGVYTCGAGN